MYANAECCRDIVLHSVGTPQDISVSLPDLKTKLDMYLWQSLLFVVSCVQKLSSFYYAIVSYGTVSYGTVPLNSPIVVVVANCAVDWCSCRLCC